MCEEDEAQYYIHIATEVKVLGVVLSNWKALWPGKFGSQEYGWGYVVWYYQMGLDHGYKEG
jgi:hypothetical protein